MPDPPPSTYHQFGGGPRVYTRDDRSDRQIWKERLLESARLRDDLIGSPRHEDRRFEDGRLNTAAVVGGDGQNVEIDLTNTTVLVDPKTNRNLYRNDSTRKVSPEAQRIELDLDNRPKSAKIKGSVRHIHERSDLTPPSMKPQPQLLKRGKFNTTHKYSDRNGEFYKDDKVVGPGPLKGKYNHRHAGSNVFVHLLEQESDNEGSRRIRDPHGGSGKVSNANKYAYIRAYIHTCIHTKSRVYEA